MQKSRRGTANKGSRGAKRKKTKGEETRDRLLRCAEKVFSEKGYYETQVSDIAALAKVAKGTIYQYFKNKEHIFVSLLESYAREWEEIVALDMKDFMGDRPGIYYATEYLRRRLLKTVRFFGENQDRAAIILRVGIGVNEEFDAVMRVLEEKILKVILHDITLAQKQGYVPKDLNLFLAGNAIMGAVMRISYLLFAAGKKRPSQSEIDRLINDAVTIIANTIQMK